MNRNYDELIESANKAMLEKLKENEHKPGFDEISLDHAIHRIKDELIELNIEFDNYKDAEWDCRNIKSDLNKQLMIKSLHKVRRESADVANFSAITILKCDKLLHEIEGK
jgi:hypothetical protein